MRYGSVHVLNVVKIPPVDGFKGSAVLLALYSMDDSDEKLGSSEAEDTVGETAVAFDEMEAEVKDAIVAPGRVDVAMQLHALEILRGLHL